MKENRFFVFYRRDRFRNKKLPWVLFDRKTQDIYEMEDIPDAYREVNAILCEEHYA